MGKSKIDPEQLRSLNTFTFAEVADILHVSISAVAKAYYRFNIDRYPRPRHRPSPQSNRISETWLREHRFWTAKACATYWATCAATIHRLRRHYQIKPERKPPASKHELISMHERGLTITDIATELKLSVYVIRYWVKKYKLDMQRQQRGVKTKSKSLIENAPRMTGNCDTCGFIGDCKAAVDPLCYRD